MIGADEERGRAMRRAARAADPGSGLSVAQLEMLSCMAENPGSRPGQLARLLRLAPSSVATLSNSLRQAGLVTRTGGAGDRRTASLDLTPAGDAAVLRWKSLNERLLSLALEERRVFLTARGQQSVAEFAESRT